MARVASPDEEEYEAWLQKRAAYDEWQELRDAVSFNYSARPDGNFVFSQSRTIPLR